MLNISNLTKSYDGKTKVLNNVSLHIPTGIFGLLGPNGAGKSTFMRTLATLQTPDSGEIVFAGTDVIQHPTTMRSQLGYLPQEFGVYEGVTANDLMHYLAKLKGLSNSRVRTEQVDGLLEKVNLSQHKHKAVSQFSGGMKQRFGIAQALLGNPQILIVDEPTAGLDPQERNRFHNLLADLSEKKVVILSTHIVEDVANLCQQVAIMAAGEILCLGTPQQLQAQLEGQIWQVRVKRQDQREYLQHFNVISQRMHNGKTTFHVHSPTPPGTTFTAVQPDLEDVYFKTLNQSVQTGFRNV